VQIDAVEGAQLRGEQPDLDHGAADAVGVDIVAGAERAQQQQHEPGRHVRQRALQREPDGEADGAEHRDDARRLHAELGEHRDHHEGEDGIANEIGDQWPQRHVDFAVAVEPAPRRGVRPARGEIADDEDRDRADDADAHRHRPVGELRGPDLRLFIHDRVPGSAS